MHPRRKRRLLALSAVMLGLAIALSLVMYALRQNINLYYTPDQVSQGLAPVGHSFRLGGLVKRGSVIHSSSGLKVSFIVTDRLHDIGVDYQGILPDLFRDGQGVVVQGQLTAAGKFVADQVLAKHDEKYMPPVVSDSLQRVGGRA